MFASAVSALDLQVIDIIHRLRIAQNVVMAASDITAEKVAKFAFTFSDIQHDLSRSQNVSGVAEGDYQSVRNENGPVVIERDELPDRFLGVGRRIERLDRWQTLLGAFLGNELGIVHLNLSRVFEHNGAQIARRERA